VTDADVEAAERAKDAAITAERAASASARAARESHAEARERAGGRAAEVLDVELADAEASVRRSEDAAAEHDRLSAERTAAIAAIADLDAPRDRATTALSTARAAVAGIAERVANATRESAAARGEFDSVRARIDAATLRRDRARTLAEAMAARAAAERTATAAGDDLGARIAESVFDDALSAAAALRPLPERARLDRRIREHDAAVASERATLLTLELAALPEEPIDTAASERTVGEARTARDAAVARFTTAIHVATRLRDLVDRATDAQREIGAAADDHAVIARLAHTLAGRAPNTHRMTLETFVLAAELEEIVAAANLRLDEMSSGRYQLQHTDALAARGAASGLGLEIMDAYTGRTRPASSLSGGETFLASLSLALGLAEVVTARAGGIRLDTLFVDEGFGSLDAETLELAMRTLDELRQGGRTVGVISHVEAMKEQIPAQLLVEATASGPSMIRQAEPARPAAS
jgi:exonuclease SbcC